MDALTLVLEYVYVPLSLGLYTLHIKYVKLSTEVKDYLDFKKDIYATLNQISKDVHHLLEIRKEK